MQTVMVMSVDGMLGSFSSFDTACFDLSSSVGRSISQEVTSVFRSLHEVLASSHSTSTPVGGDGDRMVMFSHPSAMVGRKHRTGLLVSLLMSMSPSELVSVYWLLVDVVLFVGQACIAYYGGVPLFMIYIHSRARERAAPGGGGYA